MGRPDYQTICDRYDIQLHMGTPDGVDPMTNRSSCAGYEIIMGEYDDLECEILGFFHELGHCISNKEHCLPPYENWPYDAYAEAVAWKIGLRLAAGEGYETFSEEALNWAREQLGTYFDDDRVPESTPTRYLPFALRTAGLKHFETLEEETAHRLLILGLDMSLASDDPFWTIYGFPFEVRDRLKEAQHQLREATKVALTFAKKESD